MLAGIFQGVIAFVQVLRYVLLAYCLLSWFMPPYHKVMVFLGRIADPMLRGVRRLLLRFFPKLPMDLSAIVMFLLLQLVVAFLEIMYYWLAF